MKNFIKFLFFMICITSISKFAFSKSPPPGTGTADVPANILIMLDNSGSMAWDIDGRERYANNSYVNRPMDVVRDDNGDIYVYGLNTRKITVLGSDGTFKRELMGYGPGRCNMAYYGFKFDIYGINKIQPIWADHYFKTISNAKMGLNLSRGEAIKYYSSDRITQIVGNGLVCLIDEKTQYRDFFTNNEMVFYKNISDLSEKIIKISKDDKLRKKIAHKGKNKYMKFFNSTNVANFIINKTLEIKDKRYLWES